MSGIVIVDYGMGNLRSVQKAFEKNGARPRVTSNAEDIKKAGKVVLPGVGAFDAAMKELRKRGLTGVLKDKIAGGAPYLGLCLGLQLLFSESEESESGKPVAGLGIVPGRVKRFEGKLKVPHMGWNTVSFKKKGSPIFRGIKTEDYFYFVHSYYAVPKDPEWALGVTRYGTNFCSAISGGNIFATQFHPEKSQAAGLRVIKNFIDL